LRPCTRRHSTGPREGFFPFFWKKAYEHIRKHAKAARPQHVQYNRDTYNRIHCRFEDIPEVEATVAELWPDLAAEVEAEIAPLLDDRELKIIVALQLSQDPATLKDLASGFHISIPMVHRIKDRAYCKLRQSWTPLFNSGFTLREKRDYNLRLFFEARWNGYAWQLRRWWNQHTGGVDNKASKWWKAHVDSSAKPHTYKWSFLPYKEPAWVKGYKPTHRLSAEDSRRYSDIIGSYETIDQPFHWRRKKKESDPDPVFDALEPKQDDGTWIAPPPDLEPGDKPAAVDADFRVTSKKEGKAPKGRIWRRPIREEARRPLQPLWIPLLARPSPEYPPILGRKPLERLSGDVQLGWCPIRIHYDLFGLADLATVFEWHNQYYREQDPQSPYMLPCSGGHWTAEQRLVDPTPRLEHLKAGGCGVRFLPARHYLGEVSNKNPEEPTWELADGHWRIVPGGPYDGHWTRIIDDTVWVAHHKSQPFKRIKTRRVKPKYADDVCTDNLWFSPARGKRNAYSRRGRRGSAYGGMVVYRYVGRRVDAYLPKYRKETGSPEWWGLRAKRLAGSEAGYDAVRLKRFPPAPGAGCVMPAITEYRRKSRLPWTKPRWLIGDVAHEPLGHNAVLLPKAPNSHWIMTADGWRRTTAVWSGRKFRSLNERPAGADDLRPRVHCFDPVREHARAA
jgi:hypothetical protein